MKFEKALQDFAEEPLSRQLILNILSDYKRPNDKVNELLKQGKLVALKRGLYVPGPELEIPGPEPFLVANHLWGPSYVSLESALSYWGLIPERVFTISSVTLKLSRSFKTPSGNFEYAHASMPYYAFGIKSVRITPRQTILIASPEKALCDKIVISSGVALRSVKQTREFLLDDLRMNEERLLQLDLSGINSWLKDAPKQHSLEILLKTIERL